MRTDFPKNAHRYDPYKNFKFRVLWQPEWGAETSEYITVLGVSKVSALKRTTEVVTHRSGGENSWDHKSPGRTSYEGVTLERGITHDPEFEKWANMVHSSDGDTSMDLVNFKKNLILEVMNEKGHVVFQYSLTNCWVSEFTAMPDLDANANAVAIESIKIELEEWKREPGTVEPDEASDVPPT
jgi:phage tail-like protein